MKTWEARPKDEAYLFNPAFCCTVLAAAMLSYRDAMEPGFSLPLAHMVLPIVLHKPTRDTLPITTRTSMAAWLLENADARVLFYERLLSLKPYTKEAIYFGMRLNWIVPAPGGSFQTMLGDQHINRALRSLTDEARECVMRARFLGKWFSATGSSSMIMAFWGIRP